jgi:hypothetical protein
MENGNLIVQSDGFANQVCCQLVPAGLVRENPKQMQAINVAWLDGEDLTITLLGRAQPA